MLIRRLPPVLLYHAVGVRAARADQSRGLIVAATEFEAQMSSLVRKGYKALSLDEFASVLAGQSAAPRQSLLITFDDAYAHLHDKVSPILQRCGFTAVVFAAPATLGRPNTWDRGSALEGTEVATAGQLAEMRKCGWEIGSHAYDHVDLRLIEPRRLCAQLAAAREELSQRTGADVRDLAYPYGYQDPAVREAARRSGHRLAFTVKNGDPADPFRLPRHLVSGLDGRLAFNLAIQPGTSAWLHRLRDTIPPAATGAVRAALAKGVIR